MKIDYNAAPKLSKRAFNLYYESSVGFTNDGGYVCDPGRISIISTDLPTRTVNR